MASDHRTGATDDDRVDVDGGRLGMYDLKIAYSDRASGAVEVTLALDAESHVLWELVNGVDGVWIVDGLDGGWMVTLEPTARAARLRNELPRLLRDLESMGIRQLRPDEDGGDHRERSAHHLGIAHSAQGPTEVPGSVYFTIELPPERSGGWVADTGDALAEWIGPFLRDERDDVCKKLAASGAWERHAFVIFPGFSTAPFAVTDLLMRDDAPLPTVAPQLPPAVTHVWAMGTWSSGSGFRWSKETSWMRFTRATSARRRPPPPAVNLLRSSIAPDDSPRVSEVRHSGRGANERGMRKPRFPAASEMGRTGRCANHQDDVTFAARSLSLKL